LNDHKIIEQKNDAISAYKRSEKQLNKEYMDYAASAQNVHFRVQQESQTFIANGSENLRDMASSFELEQLRVKSDLDFVLNPNLSDRAKIECAESSFHTTGKFLNTKSQHLNFLSIFFMNSVLNLNRNFRLHRKF